MYTAWPWDPWLQVSQGVNNKFRARLVNDLRVGAKLHFEVYIANTKAGYFVSNIYKWSISEIKVKYVCHLDLGYSPYT